MPKIIDIREFKSLFTNADLEDIDQAYSTKQENLRSLHGKLVKTFGYGEKISDAIRPYVKNLFTYSHDEIADEKLYIIIKVNPSSRQITVYGYNGSSWVVINNITEFTDCFNDVNYYHCYRRNPVIHHDRIARMLPGNASKFGSVEAKGVWLGHIDREFFDGIYDPTTKFYDYPTEIVKPEITFSPTQIDGGYNKAPFTDEVKYYRFSYVYDGIQESLLSDVFSVYFGTDKFLKLDFSITKASHNKRITSMNVYRADEYDVDANQDGIYRKIHSIDFLRESGKVYGPVPPSNCAYNGNFTIYIHDLYEYEFQVGGTYTIKLWFGSGESEFVAITIQHPGAGVGTEIFKLYDPSTFSDIEVHPKDYWDCRWSLLYEGGGVANGNSGAFGGEHRIFIDDDNLGINNFRGGVIYFYDESIPEKRIIASNDKRAFGFSGDTAGDDSSPHSWKAIKPSDGNYIVEENGDDVDYNFYDTGLLEGIEHPLYVEGIPQSIKVNGKYAKVINGRLWQGYIVLDPGGKGEIHWDWISYSEYGQLDVTPVSNVRYIADREGGSISGLAEIFGKPVFTKEKAIICINTKTTPYTIYESVHNIGNIAEEGLIEVLDNLYVCDFDGIYRLSPNNLAESDMTPTEKLRISEPINNLYNSLSLEQKKSIKTEYDQEKHEILFYIPENVEINLDSQNLEIELFPITTNFLTIETLESQSISITLFNIYVWLGVKTEFIQTFGNDLQNLQYYG